MIGVYKITSPSNRVYVGSSKNIERRFNDYKLLKCKDQIKLYNSFIKYGVESHSFQILIECLECELYEYEHLYGCHYNVLAKDNLNLRLPNFKDVKGVISDESRIRMSENHPSKHNKEWLEKTKERLAAQSKNKDIVEKIRQKNKGTKRPTTSKKNIEYQSRLSKEEKIEIANKRKQTILSKNNGKWHTDEFRLNMSKRLKGVSLSIEHKQKLSKNHGLKRKVINIITSEVYDSAAKAAEKNGMVYGTLVSKLIGRRKNNTNLKYYEG